MFSAFKVSFLYLLSHNIVKKNTNGAKLCLALYWNLLHRQRLVLSYEFDFSNIARPNMCSTYSKVINEEGENL